MSLPIDVAVDPVLGRYAFTSQAGTRSEASFAYGFSGRLGGGPYSRSLPETPRALDAPVGAPIHVPSPGIATLADAVAAWQDAGRPHQVIQINDNRTYAAGLAIELGGTDLVIQAAQGVRPVLVGDLAFHAGFETTALTLDGLLVAGRLLLHGPIGSLTISHSTLLPRASVPLDERLAESAYASLVVDPPGDALTVTLDHSIAGSLSLPSTVAQLVLRDSIVDAPRRCALPALVSGPLQPFPKLSSADPKLLLSLAGEAPCLVAAGAVPKTLAEACGLWQRAIRKASPAPAFRLARVVTLGDRLAILPGVAGAVTVAAYGEDPTAGELRLLPPAAIPSSALVGDPLEPQVELAGAAELQVRLPRGAVRRLSLGAGKMTPVQLAEKLDAQFAGSFRRQAEQVWMGLLDDRLVLVWAAAGSPFRLGATGRDLRSIAVLGLECDWPAVSADQTGAEAGPPARVERSTVLGPMHLRELELAADSIFTDPLRVERRQSGCVRFCSLAPSSATPHAAHCSPPGDVPEFSARGYAQPAYMQLAGYCSATIGSGAANGAEMGAFNELLQPQREANLRGSLEEYLRFGLEAGIFFVN